MRKIEEREEGGGDVAVLCMTEILEKVKGGKVINLYLPIAQAVSSFPSIHAPPQNIREQL